MDDFNKLDLRPSNLSDNDVIGDSYEYMIAKFASDAGKKGGEFFTPSMVSELIARLVKPEENDRIYDPACGSGSLLIRAFKKVPNGKGQIYGQERNGQTHSLCRMNMFLHGIDDAKIAWGDTLSNPLHLENDKLINFRWWWRILRFPLINGQWVLRGEVPKRKNLKKDSQKSIFKMEASLDKHRRFEWGVPPSSKAIMPLSSICYTRWRKTAGWELYLPHGVLFRGASEGKSVKK